MAKRKKQDPEQVLDWFPPIYEGEAAERLSDHRFTEYGFYYPVNRKERVWRFTCCGEGMRTSKGACVDVYEPDAHRYKHNDMMHCPFCGAEVAAKCVTRMPLSRNGTYESLKECRNVCQITSCEAGLLVVTGVIWREWVQGNGGVNWGWEEVPGWPEEVFDCWEQRRYFIAPGEVYAWKNCRVWNGSGLPRAWEWTRQKSPSRRPFQPWTYFHRDEENGAYSTVGVASVADSGMKYCGLDHYCGDLWDGMFNYPVVTYLVESALHPQLEMLTKLGHDDVINELMEGWRHSDVLNWRAKRPNDFFRLSKADYKCFRENRGRLSDLETLTDLKDVTLETYYDIQRVCCLRPGDLRLCVDVAKRLGISLKKAAAYAGKGNSVMMWRDYLDAAEKLELDLSREDVAMPKNLRVRHDEAVALVSCQENAALRDAYRKRILPKLRRKYAFSMDGLSIVVPETDVQIITEGKMLQHCVGGYAERHMKGRVVILFLRRDDAPEESYVTIEMSENKIVQAHGFRNDFGAEPPRKVHREFFDTWIAWLERGSLRYADGQPKIEQEVKTA